MANLLCIRTVRISGAFKAFFTFKEGNSFVRKGHVDVLFKDDNELDRAILTEYGLAAYYLPRAITGAFTGVQHG